MPTRPSAPRDVSHFASPLVSHVQGIEATLVGPEERPVWSPGCVVCGCEGLCAPAVHVCPHQLLEALVVDPRAPVSIDLELFVGYQEAVGVLVLAGDAVVWEELGQLLDKVHDLLVPGDVGHGEAAGRAVATVRHPLDLDEVWFSEGHQVSVGFELIHIPSFHQCQPIDRALLLEK